MNNEDILKSDLLDLIFDKRNKSYGAYELRKHYKGRLIKALVVAFVFAGGLAAFASFMKEEEVLTSIFTIPEPEPTGLKPVVPEKLPEKPVMPEAPKTASAAKTIAQQKFVQNFVITKNESEADKLPTDLENTAIGNKTVAGDPPRGEVYVDPPSKIDEGGNNLPAPVDKLTPRAAADIMPAYPGGMKELKRFLEKNLKSFDDIESGQVVSVKITFVVGYDGRLKSFQVMEDGGDMYNKEVIRVLKKMPEWIPGKANGENVSVYYTIPVKFTAAE